MTKRDETVIKALEENIKTCAIFGAPTDLFKTLLTEYRRVVDERDEAIKDLTRYAGECGDSCKLCANYKPCPERECPQFVEGNEGEINGHKLEFKWTCMDFDFGDCPALENTPCHDCGFTNNWVYRKVYRDAEE